MHQIAIVLPLCGLWFLFIEIMGDSSKKSQNNLDRKASLVLSAFPVLLETDDCSSILNLLLNVTEMIPLVSIV